MLKTKFRAMLGKNLQATVTIDAALADLLDSAGYRADKDLQVVWAACHVLSFLGFVKMNQKSIKMKDRPNRLDTYYKATKELRQLMVDCGLLSEAEAEMN